MSRKIYEKFDGTEVTDGMLQEAAQLFSENYGVWSKDATRMMGAFAREGNRVRIGKNRLRNDHLPNGATCLYVRVTVNGHLSGNVFACRWTYETRSVCWVTQLVVHREYRGRGLATGLLNELRQVDDQIYGVLSSHPATCLATARAFSRTITAVQPDFIGHHAEAIMKASPITYVKHAKVCGSLFRSEDPKGTISCADTGFYVDHGEPLEALAWVREVMDWPLGDLIPGHEFLACSRNT